MFDRDKPIARLVPIEGEECLQIHEPVRPITDLKRIKGVRLGRRIDAARMLRNDRDSG